MTSIISKILLLGIFSCFLFYTTSCSKAKQKTKETINQTGEIVGKGASEFISGIATGVDETFDCKINLSVADIEYGKFKIKNNSDSNSLSIYIIFNKNFRDTLLAKVKDSKGVEYGRAKAFVEGTKEEATYINFVFSPETVLESKSIFEISKAK